MADVKPALLRLLNVAVGYARPYCLLRQHINAAIYPGQCIALLGGNGAGKSTLLRTIAGLHTPLAGTVYWGQHPLIQLPIHQRARHIGLVVAKTPVGTEMLRVDEAVALGRHPHLDWLGRLKPQDRQQISEALAQTHLTELAHRALGTLSDGQKQQVMLARALAQTPRLLLLDEPTAFLDMAHRLSLRTQLQRISQATQCAMVVTTHDLEWALDFADTLWLLPYRQSTLIQGAPEALALQNAFETLFHDPVRLDPRRGRFEVRSHHAAAVTRYVRLEGSEPGFYWTAHGLRRIGVELNTCSAMRVRVRQYNQYWRWTLQYGSDPTEHYDQLADLLSHLRQANTWQNLN